MAKAEVCKTSIRRFDSGRRLQSLLFGPLIGARNVLRGGQPAGVRHRKKRGFRPVRGPGFVAPNVLRRSAGGPGPRARKETDRATSEIDPHGGHPARGRGGPRLRPGPRPADRRVLPPDRDCGSPVEPESGVLALPGRVPAVTVGEGDFDGLYGGSGVQPGRHAELREVGVSLRRLQADDRQLVPRLHVGRRLGDPAAAAAVDAAARRDRAVPADEQARELRALRRRRHRRGLLRVRGGRRLRRLPAGERYLPLRLRTSCRTFTPESPSGPRRRRASASTSTATSRSWARAATSGAKDGHGRRLRAQRSPGSSTRSTSAARAFTVGLHVRF